MTQPIMPDDQDLDYLVTQAIADFLADAKQPRIDGIAFPSSQSSKKALNVVLFRNAAGVELLDIPVGTKIASYTTSGSDDGPETDYWVYENLPATGVPSETFAVMSSNPQQGLNPTTDCDRVGRPVSVSLRVDPKSLVVHHVQAVTVTTKRYKVSRHRSTQGDRFKF